MCFILCYGHINEHGHILLQVVLTILPATNTPPMFDSDTFYPDLIIIPQPVDTFVFNLADVASDADSPKIGVGEIVFEEVSENRHGTGRIIFP